MGEGSRDTVRILIVDSDATEAEAILNVFRDAGHATRAQHITSVESLEDAMAEKQKWDLLLVSDLPEGLNLSTLIDYIAQQGRDIPALVMTDYEDSEESLAIIKLGGRVVIPRDNDEYLLLAALNEIESLKIRRHYRRMSVALNESEKQRRMLLDDQVDAIVYIGDGQVRYTNPAFMGMLGMKESESIIGKPFKDLVADSDRSQVEEFLINTEDSAQAMAVIQCPLMVQGGDELSVRAVITPTSFEGEFTLSLLVRSETPDKVQTAEQQIAEERAAKQENTVLNKQQFQEQLDVAIQRVVAGKSKRTLLCMTADNLKEIHEKEGRQVSQPLLKGIAERIMKSLGEEQPIASWGGGIFMSLIKVSDKSGVQAISDQILESISEPFEIEGNRYSIQLSLGAMMLTDTSNDAKTLLVRARHGATLSQKQGGGKLNFYQQRKVNVVSSVEKHLAGMVSQALKNDNMQLLYQPVVSLKGTAEEYYEVQLRMTDVRGREHDATSFRTRLDKNALWGKVDRWQLIQASKDLMAKRKSGHDTRLILHVGACAVTDDSFVPWMGVALKAAGIPPSAIAVELSETNLVKLKKQVPTFLETLKSMGCQTMVTDFGCSLNPLATIEPLDIDLVKMDPSFTKDLNNEDKGAELQKMIEALAKKECKVIVPQVESAAEMAPLWQNGVDFIQGPFLQKPAKAMDFDFGSDL